ncbi:MAG TPA: hypothetical protein VGN88_12345 [Phycisphaerae bacterium]
MQRHPFILIGVAVLAGLLMVGISGFLWVRSGIIDIPAAPIDKIHVWGGTDRHELSVIIDPKIIASLEAFLNARKSGWYSPFGTAPTGEYDLIFEAAATHKYILWISLDSANWIGFRSFENPGHDLYRDISPADHASLLKLFALPKP